MFCNANAELSQTHQSYIELSYLKNPFLMEYDWKHVKQTCWIMFVLLTMVQVALKRQQAAEDAIALGLRAVTTGEPRVALPQGPIVGRPHMTLALTAWDRLMQKSN